MNNERSIVSFERISAQPQRDVTFGSRDTTSVTSTVGQTTASSRSRNIPILQSGCEKSSDPISVLLEYSPGRVSETSDGSAGTMDFTNVQHSVSGLHSSSNFSSKTYEPVSYGRMDRPPVSPAERNRPSNPQYGGVGCYSSGDSLLSDAPDTDLCLSMVHETRPSYQMKTYGKTPLTQPHLLSLVASSDLPKSSSQSPKLSPYSSMSSHMSYSAGAAVQVQTQSVAKPLNTSNYSTRPMVSPGSAANRSTMNSLNSTPTVDYQRPTRTFSDFDPDEYLKDLKLPDQTSSYIKSTDQSYSKSMYSTSATAPGLSPSSSKYPYVSPNAKGLAPPPTDQPIRNPAKVGIEADVDALTIRMIRNMESGYGAAGEYNCVKCSEGISGNRPGCTALDKTYHLKCFTCTVCNNELAGGPFYSVEGKPYCESDYYDTLEKCIACSKPIMDRILRASGKAYHPHCFICTSCARSLDGIPFTVDANNAVHCVQCFHDKFAPRCAICHKPIVPEEGKQESMRVVAMDKSFHVNCYKCEDCAMLLSSKIEGHECYPLDDHLLCKKCNAARIRKLTA